MLPRSRNWSISINTEILFMTILGICTTIMEGSIMNMSEILNQIWSVNFPLSLFSVGMENLLKTLMCGIVLARAFSIHIYVAAYLLLIYPIFMEKRRILLVFWLSLSAIRSILLNSLATLSGMVLCSVYNELKPACFEFSAMKAIELACSVYMWISVHEFYFFIQRNRSLQPTTKTSIACGLKRRARSSWREKSSFTDQIDLPESFWEALNLDSESSSSEDSLSSVNAQLTVDWFMDHVRGFKEHKCITVPMGMSENAKKFLEMSPVEIIRLQRRLSSCLVAQEERDAARGWKEDTLGENVGEAVGNMMLARITNREQQQHSRASSQISRSKSLSREPSRITKSVSSQTLQLSVRALRRLEETSKEILQESIEEEKETEVVEVEEEEKAEERVEEVEKEKAEERIKEEGEAEERVNEVEEAEERVEDKIKEEERIEGDKIKEEGNKKEDQKKEEDNENINEQIMKEDMSDK